jgi:hypothetical protein
LLIVAQYRRLWFDFQGSFVVVVSLIQLPHRINDGEAGCLAEGDGHSHGE